MTTKGRPPMLDAVLRYRETKDDQGTVLSREPVTVSQAIIEALRVGSYMEQAALAAGVSKQTLYAWLRLGAAACMKREKGADLTQRERRRRGLALTEREQTYAEFSDAVARAQAEAELHDVMLLQQLANGGLVVQTITEKVANGQVVERSTKRETLAPSPAVLMWRLERRNPDRWGRVRVELTGRDGGPVELRETAAGLVESLRAFQAGADAQREIDERKAATDADDT